MKIQKKKQMKAKILILLLAATAFKTRSRYSLHGVLNKFTCCRLDPVQFELINNTILPDAVQFWEKALSIRRSENVIKLGRKCEQTQVFVKDGRTHCIDGCREKTMCGEVEVPEEHLDVCRVCNATGQECGPERGSLAGPGIENADFVFYVSAMQTERCNKSLTVAYASHCQQESALDRPIAGHANLCPASISTKPQELETLLSTVKHEILHALGFSVSLYAFYRDAQGRPLTERHPDTGKPPLDERLQTYRWSERVIRVVARPGWQVRGGTVTRHVHVVVTPRVRREVRAHFACERLEGAELEDQGEEGTALTHWEKRAFENEAMTGTHTHNPVVSRVTLAFMEDTGWYRPNYSMAEPMSWGRGLGCDFATKSCKEWMGTMSAAGRSIHPYCDKVKRDPLQTECTEDRASVALCNLVNHTVELPLMYQNFDRIEHVETGGEGYFGGSVSLADYCPYIQEFTWRNRDVIVRGSHCQYEENNPRPDKNFALELYGTESRCFEHSRDMWEERSCRQVRQWQHWGSGCYRYSCDDGRLHVLVANYTYACYHPGQEISVRVVSGGWLRRGAIRCPPCRELCPRDTCRAPEEPRPSTTYPRDELECTAASASHAALLASLLTVVVFALT